MKTDEELKHISDDEIRKDIDDTRLEITTMTRRKDSLLQQVKSLEDGIMVRWKLIDELQNLLKPRKS